MAAYTRYYAGDDPVLFLPRLDRESQFVQAHPLGWGVNQKVLQERFGWNVFTASPSLLSVSNNNNNNNKKHAQNDQDLSGLQSPDMPFLLSNAAVPPSNSWHPYLESVHFDETTGLALVALEQNHNTAGSEDFSWSPIESAMSALDYIASQNRRQQCPVGEPPEEKKQEPSISSTNTSSTSRNGSQQATHCWIPVVVVHAKNKNDLRLLIASVTNHTQPPALVMDLAGQHEGYAMPQIVQGGTWVVSQPLTKHEHLHAKLAMDTKANQLIDFALIKHDLQSPLPTDMLLDDNSSLYQSDIEFLRGLADEAIANDPTIGTSNSMPSIDSCTKNECMMGNLVADSLRWKTNTDVALVAASTLQGPGWRGGDVKVSDIWKALPEALSACTGNMRGATLLHVLDAALGINSTSPMFPQVSGLKIVLAAPAKDAATRLVSVKIWDSFKQLFLDINLLGMYKITAEGKFCAEIERDYITSGSNQEKIVLGDMLVQNMVGDYLGNLDSRYQPHLDGRLQEGSGSLMDLTTTSAVCMEGSYWHAEKANCLSCPNKKDFVTLSDTWIDLSFQEGTTDNYMGRFVIVNRDLHDFMLVTRDLPPWFTFISESTPVASVTTQWPDVPLKITGGERIAFDYEINTTNMTVGVTFASVILNVTDLTSIPECVPDKYGLTLDAFIKVEPANTTVDLGVYAVLGLVMMGVILAACVGLLSWLVLRREHCGYGDLGDKSTRQFQPLYLGTLCLGVLLMALSIAPLSVAETSASCLAAPWLLSLGLTFVFSALLSKLTTAMKMIETPNLREKRVSTKDVLIPFVILFVINFTILFCMLIDPPTRGQQAAGGEEDWKFYGVCEYSELTATMAYISGFVHLLTLIVVGVQAYRLSTSCDDFRESQSIGLSVFIWLQMTILCLPFWSMFEDSDVTGKYIFTVGCVGALCMSMLLCIFVPVISKAVDARKSKKRTDEQECGNENNHSILGGFLDFTSVAGGTQVAPLSILAHEDRDEEGNRCVERDRCMANRFCY